MGAKQVREPLSRERVLEAAVALVDAEGMPALTMRRLATVLGVEAMSLYYHLPGKEALLDGLVDTVVNEIDLAVRDAEEAAGAGQAVDAGEDWRTVLRRRFLLAREVMLRHPWMPALLGSRPVVPVGVLRYYDRIVATLTAAGFSYRITHRALHAFGSLALGFAQETFSPTSAGGSMDADRAQAELVAMAGTLPHLTKMITAEVHDVTDPTLGWCDSQTEFEFTLDLLLDGLARARG